MNVEQLLRNAYADRASQAPVGRLDGLEIRRLAHRRRTQRRGASLLASLAAAALVLGVVLHPWTSTPRVTQAPPAASRTSAEAPGVPRPAATSGVVPLVSSGECAGLAVTAHLEAAPGLVWRIRPGAASENLVTIPGNTLLRLSATGPCLDRLTYVTDGAVLQGPSGGGTARFGQDGSAFIVAHSAAAARVVVSFTVEPACQGGNCPAGVSPAASVTVDVLPGTGLQTSGPSTAG